MSRMSGSTVTKSPDKDDKILRAATKVFAEQGFSNADTQAIADLAEVGKGTLYRYYGSKEEMFLAVADYGMRNVTKYIYDAIEGIEDTVSLVRRAGIAYAEFFQNHPELVEILIQERATFRDSIPATHLVYREKNRGVFEDILRCGIEAGVIRDVNVRDVTTTLANALYGTVVCGNIEGSSPQLTRTAAIAIDLVLRGIVVDAASLHQGE